MESLDFDLELVTPAFVAGAAAREASTELSHQVRRPRHSEIGMAGDGLRIPSLRGVLRFWYRAKEGLDLDRLSPAEAAVFGSTERGQGLRLVPAGQTEWKAEEIITRAGSARSYLGYGPLNYVRERKAVSSHNQFAFRDAIPARTRFSFRAFGSMSQLEQLKRTLMLLHLFGGVGGRSRRGWGSITVDCPGLPKLRENEGLGTWMARCLDFAWPEGQRPSERRGSRRYSCFSQKSVVRWLEHPAGNSSAELTTYDQVFDAFLEIFGTCRLSRQRGGESVPKLVKADQRLVGETLRKRRVEEAPSRLAFGMPYTVRFSEKEKVEYVAHLGSGKEISRRASPLLLKVMKKGQDKFAGVALFLDTPFFGSEGSTIGAEGLSGSVPPPGYAAIREFLSHPAWQTLNLP